VGFLIDTGIWVAVERGHDFRIQDLWLAAQAIQHGHRFLTFNKKDFQDIPGLDLAVMPHPGNPPSS